MSKWNAPCADCGTMLPGNAKSLPAGQRLCHPCRRMRAGRPSEARAADQPRPCAHCGASFVPPPTRSERRVCSDECGRARMAVGARLLSVAQTRPGPCDDCGAPTVRARNQAGRFCAECSKTRAKERNARKDHGWTKSALLPSVRVLASRDNYVCHVCGGDVDMTLPFNDRMAPTRDHIVPRHLGGGHDPSNLKLAHRGCNSRRGAPLPV